MLNVELLHLTEDPIAHIARCARVSHRSEGTGPEADAELVRKLIGWGHLSVLEFAHATFLVEGLSRACANQLTRHRLASFVQESQRYVEVGDRELVQPQSIADSGLQGEAEGLYEQARSLYRRLVAAGVPKEDARYVLPICAETRLVMNVNFREAHHIIGLRGSRHAQWEIRSLAKSMLSIMRKEAPVAFEDLEVST
ncbi:MAG: FAD-dependent thymidylate synthase [Candidatus Bipolaricaulota bacterium]